MRASLIALALFLTLSGQLQAYTQAWQRIQVEGTTYEIFVVSESPLTGGFPERQLDISVDGLKLRDIYVVDTTTGDVLDRLSATKLVALVQSGLKPLTTVARNGALMVSPQDTKSVATSYPLLTSAYFRDFIVETLGINGVEGLNNYSQREDLYKELIYDMVLQPDLLDSPELEAALQQLLDRTQRIEGVAEILGESADVLSDALDSQSIPLTAFRLYVGKIADQPNPLSDIRGGSSNTHLDRLKSQLDAFAGLAEVIEQLTNITGAAARQIVLYVIAQERAELRLRALEEFVFIASTNGGNLDPAFLSAIPLARTDIEEYTGTFFDALPSILLNALQESGTLTIAAKKVAKWTLNKLFAGSLSKIPAKVALPYVLSYKTFQGIRVQNDRIRRASLAATLHHEFFQPYGLNVIRVQAISGSDFDGESLQNYLELLQMGWYLAQRHHSETLNTLNNTISWFAGALVDLFSAGKPYDDFVRDVKRQIEYTRTVASRLNTPEYGASVKEVESRSQQNSEHGWLAGLVRSSLVPGPSEDPSPQLDVCVTLPFDPNGTPATEGVSIRFEPRACSDPQYVGNWECGENDPDGNCDANVSLFWDNDTNPSNASCDDRQSGPCPIPGAQSMNPRRRSFTWEPLADGLDRTGYYVYATISSHDQVSANYSTGFYEFIDPIFEADAWDIDEIILAEGGQVSDGDGIPEVGETASIELSLQNISGRHLDLIKIRRLRIEGDGIETLAPSDWDSNNPGDLLVSSILDDDILLTDAVDGAIALPTDDFDVYVGTLAPQRITFLAWVEYRDLQNPERPDLRRTQVIGFEIQLSNGTDAPQLSCAGTTLITDTDGDGIFESEETGGFLVQICNAGTWPASDIEGVFLEAPPQGVWTDEDSPFQNLAPGECANGTDTYRLRLERTDCGTYNLPLTVFATEAAPQVSTCSISANCVPRQSMIDNLDLGTLSTGDSPTDFDVPVTNSGSAALVIDQVSIVGESSGVSITTPLSIVQAGATGNIVVTIDPTVFSAGVTTRTIRADSNANNSGERESVLQFGITEGQPATQITTGGATSIPDISSGNLVFARGGDIFVQGVHSGVVTQITDTVSQESLPRIDGSRVVFARMESGDNNIFYYDLVAESETRVTNLFIPQTRPDISGDVIVWRDDRAGAREDDVYKYQIGTSSLNGELLVDLGSQISIDRPRIDGDYVGFLVKRWTSDSTNFPSIGYHRISTATTSTIPLEQQTPICRAGNRLDVNGKDLVFECDCGNACDDKEEIYYVDMSAGSSPTRITCDNLGDDREEPALLTDAVIYKLDGADDIYSAAIPTACSTEIPLHVGISLMENPGADPDDGSYVFISDESGQQEIWGVLSPPNVDLSVEGVDSGDGSFVQGTTYSVLVDVRNRGRSDVINVSLNLVSDSTTLDTLTAPLIVAGQLLRVPLSFQLGGAPGLYDMSALIDGEAISDDVPSNNEIAFQITLVDDDTSAPSISGVTLSPANGDGDAFIEEDELIVASFTVTDTNGISVASTEIVGSGEILVATETSPAQYETAFSLADAGEYSLSITATDNDDSQETATIVQPFSVYSKELSVLDSIPQDGATNVGLESVLDISFSEDLNPGSLTDLSLNLDRQGTSIEFSFAYDSSEQRLVVTPSQTLAPGELYSFTIFSGATGVLDMHGNSLPNDFVLSFQTQTEAPDVIDPVVVVDAPLDGTSTESNVIAANGMATDDRGITGFTINGVPVNLDGNGNFSYIVSLVIGSNVIVFDAEDGAGNSAMATRSVTRLHRCFVLNLDHTGLGADPIADPASSSACPSGQFEAGDIVALSGFPNPGWEVARWTGTANDRSRSSSNAVEMPVSDSRVIAHYLTENDFISYSGFEE